MRQIDCATVGGYYGSDSAGTFLTCVGVLTIMGIKEFGYMPVLLAVMETPGCLVCLTQISRLRRNGMDRYGNMPGEEGYATPGTEVIEEENGLAEDADAHDAAHGGGTTVAVRRAAHTGTAAPAPADNGNGHTTSTGLVNWKVIHEVFFNPGLYFLFGGIIVGMIAGKLFIPYGKENVIASENLLFVTLMHGVLCLFLLEMGITACQRLRDLKTAGIGFIIFGIAGPESALPSWASSPPTSTAWRWGTRSRFSSMPSSRCCAGRPRTSRCRPSSAWPFPRPARPCLWPPRWD